MTSDDEQPFDADLIEKLKSRDQRWRDVETAIKVEEELRSSTVLKLVLEIVEKEAVDALELMIHADPANVSKMTSLQAIVKRSRIIGDSIEAIRQKGAFAQSSLEAEGPVHVDEEEQLRG